MVVPTEEGAQVAIAGRVPPSVQFSAALNWAATVNVKHVMNVRRQSRAAIAVKVDIEWNRANKFFISAQVA
jgi:hypothetical protein